VNLQNTVNGTDLATIEYEHLCMVKITETIMEESGLL
jgi:hypothetical protein